MDNLKINSRANSISVCIHCFTGQSWIYGCISREKISDRRLVLCERRQRYRSIGCEPCCAPVDSEADTVDKIVEELKTTKVAERSGRAQDKERLI